MELTNNTSTGINYSSRFFKAKNSNTLDYEGFFNNYKCDEEKIAKIKKEIKRLTNMLQEKNGECACIMNKRYNEGFSPLGTPRYFSYTNKNGDNFLYDIESGILINDEDIEGEYKTVRLSRKTGSVDVVVGYAFDLGSVVVRRYNFNIPSNNARIALTFVYEIVIPIIDRTAPYWMSNANGEVTTLSRDNYCSYLDETIDAGDFLYRFYNMEPKNIGFSLKQAFNHYNSHPSMETLIRQVNNTEDLDMLLKMSDTEFKSSVAQYIGITKNEFNTMNQKNIIKNYLMLKNVLDNPSLKSTQGYLKISDKTVPEWIDLIEKSKGWEEDMSFYQITIDSDGLLCQLIRGYCGGGSNWYYHDYKDYYKYYTFGDFCAYVVEGVINQGYRSVKDFLNMLADYFKMCNELHTEPNPFSGYLSQTHDITSRNYKLHLDEVQEQQFKERYEGFKPWVSKDKKYILIAPKDAEDIKKAGSELNNCLSSYIQKVINDNCRIYFFRLMSNIEANLIAVEYRDGKMVQVKRSHNRPFNDTDKQYLLECCKDMKWEFDA